MQALARHHFWLQTRRLTAGLLGLWLLVNFAVPWFARQLNSLHGFGFSAGYWLAAEGALLLYLAIIVVYVLRMERLESALMQAQSEAAQLPHQPPAHLDLN
jgi:putative solute:sodium symporter small subunit